MSFRIRLLCVFALCVVLTSAAFPARSDRDQERYAERFEKTVAMAPDGTLDLSNIAGDIQITSWARTEVKIEAVKTSRAASQEEARENADQVRILVTQTGNGVHVKTDYPNREGNFNVSVDYVVTVPSMTSLDVSSVSGDITATGCGGNVRLKSVSGDVRSSQIGGSSELESVSGDLSLDSVGGEGSGKTVSGDVTLASVGGPVSAESVSGEIELVEAAGAGMNLEASTFSGKIRSDFPLTGEEVSHNRLSGDINGGGKRIHLRSFSGSISLKKK
jgi:hypothetical protein